MPLFFANHWHLIYDCSPGSPLSPRQVCSQICCRDPQHLPEAMSAGFQVLTQSLDAAHRSLDFYTGQMRSLSDIESLRNERCLVCLTPKDDLAALVMLPCSHIFHRDCIRSALETNPRCPYCRAHAPPKSMSSVLLEANLVSCRGPKMMHQGIPEICEYSVKAWKN